MFEHVCVIIRSIVFPPICVGTVTPCLYLHHFDIELFCSSLNVHYFQVGLVGLQICLSSNIFLFLLDTL